MDELVDVLAPLIDEYVGLLVPVARVQNCSQSAFAGLIGSVAASVPVAPPDSLRGRALIDVDGLIKWVELPTVRATEAGAECVEMFLSVIAIHIAVGTAVDCVLLTVPGPGIDIMLVAQGAGGVSPFVVLVVPDDSADAVRPDSDLVSSAAALLLGFEFPFSAKCQ